MSLPPIKPSANMLGPKAMKNSRKIPTPAIPPAVSRLSLFLLVVVLSSASLLAQPVFTSSTNAPPGTVGQPYTFVVSASGSPTNYTASSLPPGFLTPQSSSSGTFTGLPQTPGTYTSTVTAVNASGSNSSKVVIRINPPAAPVLVSSVSVFLLQNQSNSYSLASFPSQSNVPTTFSASGLPPGLTLTNVPLVNPAYPFLTNLSNSFIRGTNPTAGSFLVPVVTSNAGGAVTNIVTFIINPSTPPVFTANTLATTATVALPFSFDVTALNSPQQFTVTSINAGVANVTNGFLTNGLSFSNVTNGSSVVGRIYGTPGQTSVITLVLAASNSAGLSTGRLTNTITVGNPTPIVVLTQPLDTANYVTGSSFYLNATAFSNPDDILLPSSYGFTSGGAPVSGTVGIYGSSFGLEYYPAAAATIIANAQNAFGTPATSAPGLPMFASTARSPLPRVDMLPLNRGQSLSAGGTVVLSAQADIASTRATIERVEFYVNKVYVGASTTPTAGTTDVYEYSWKAPTIPGSFQVTARAVSLNWTQVLPAAAGGGTIDWWASVITPKPIIVNTIQGVAASISIISPSNNANLNLNVPNRIRASAFLPGGAIDSVEFFANGRRIASSVGTPNPDLTVPFEIDFTPTSYGAYDIYAIATGSNGLQTASPSVIVNVPSGIEPTVQFTAPAADTTVPQFPLTLAWTATDADGFVASVDITVNGSLLQTVAGGKGSLVYTFPSEGTFQFVAMATDNSGNTAVSETRTIVVSNQAGSTPQGTVTGVFNTVLSRLPTSEQNDYWVSAISNGTTESDMVMQIIYEDEYSALQNKLFGYYYKARVAPVQTTYLSRLALMTATSGLSGTTTPSFVPAASYPAVGGSDAPYGATTGDATAAQQIISSAAFAAANPGVQNKSRQDFMTWYFSRWPKGQLGPVNDLLASMSSYAPSTEAKGYAVSFINALYSAYGDGPGSAYDYQLKATSLQWLYKGIWAAPTVPAVASYDQLKAFVQLMLGGGTNLATKMLSTSAVPELAATQGTPSAASKFYVYAQNIVGTVTITAEPGLQVSADGYTFADTVQVTASPTGQEIYVRVSALASAGSIKRSVSVSAPGALPSNVELQVKVAGNAFKLVSDTYSGTFGDGDLSALFPARNGCLAITTRPDGSFAGTLFLNGLKHAFTGKFNQSAGASVTIPRRGQSQVSLDLAFDTQRLTHKITGTVKVDDSTSPVVALPRIFTGKPGSRHPKAGKRYDVVLPAPDSGVADGRVSLVVAANGKVTISGKLGDGKVLSIPSAALDGDNDGMEGQWIVPVYAAPYGLGSCVDGEIYIGKGQDPDNSGISGNLGWVRPASASFPNGFRRSLILGEQVGGN